ncbi:methyltransferase [Iodidimonas nitroreducens]|uniref:Methyltransferase n=1 Tax=Iodidimonas nitroreducens TaxID=1236968 RepID=A0A5A7N328_9PROT|nr:class I SAM-dependent methyltransferase [Iodidimonas nitroreducens]GAK32173.1 demethylmenaquinone methyltransferase [alpha proteobacterium Q-1]GER02673.1 methyltransferase [Iodidimonas nitroreducens]
MITRLQKARYLVGQSARMGFFASQYMMTRKLAGADDETDHHPSMGSDGRDRDAPDLPSKAAIRAAMRDLVRQDLANIDAGYYPSPKLIDDNPFTTFGVLRSYFADLPSVTKRRRQHGHSDVQKQVSPDDRYPRYYLQNFHYQSGGWLTDDSARLYDHQVEVLFSGTADAMRRQALVPFKKHFGSRREPQITPRPRLLDIGSGTGRFLKALRQILPHARLNALEPSPAYGAVLQKAVPSARLHAGFAEAMPFEPARFDGLSAVYLFHELPPKIRRQAMAEIARVLKPGGLFVLADSLQYGDQPAFDGLLARFPTRFHEPYYESYLKTDLGALAAAHGLVQIDHITAFLTGIMVFEKR